MPEVIGVRFKSCGKIYDFEVNGVEVHEGDLVVVESELGLSIGNVIMGRHTLEDPDRELKKVIRKVTEEDLHQSQENKKLETEARDYSLERIMARGLPMKLIYTEVTLDRKRIIFYFTAEKRIDFRELVKDLAAKFKTRIEMRQIGVRDEAKIVGGMGICGRELCCMKFLTSFEPISIKMAKKQELVLNTGKLSGVCGRLMCCLGFEYSDLSSEDMALTEENSISISEDEETFGMIVTTSDSPSEAIEPPAQPGTDSQSPAPQPEKQEYAGKHRRRRRRRRRFRRN
ncbi:MAG: regulatory iron-sulfur-containing complex subunit RicT [Nitrospirota bacterium]|nr:regulatory iron-sulfur-containing complex subunit RicT [Nitrospirota bacterium]MDH5768393.1 regulatory iron-sulfur-containing complex subunit RicT [Nitrospirota bacterium]